MSEIIGDPEVAVDLDQTLADNTIATIETAEDAGSVTNTMVASVLKFLNTRLQTLKGRVDETANEAALRAAADQVINNRIDSLLGNSASEAIDNFNEVIAFLADIEDSDTLAEQLGLLRSQIHTLQTAKQAMGQQLAKLTPQKVESEDALEAMKLLGQLVEGQIYYVAEED